MTFLTRYVSADVKTIAEMSLVVRDDIYPSTSLYTKDSSAMTDKHQPSETYEPLNLLCAKRWKGPSASQKDTKEEVNVPIPMTVPCSFSSSAFTNIEHK